MKKRNLFLIAILTCSLLSLSACGKKTEQSSQNTTPQTQTEDNSTKEEVTSENSKKESLEPAVKQVMNVAAVEDFKANLSEPASLVFDSLVQLDSTYRIVPHLAKSFEHNEDFTEFTFTLPENLKFNNGENVKLEDFQRSLTILSKFHYVSFADKIKTIEMPDPITLKVSLTEPDLYFLTQLHKVQIIKASEIEEDGVIKEYIGTGPYMLKSYEPQVSATLIKNPYFYQKEGFAIEEINWMVMPDAQARKLALTSGQVDVIGITEHWPSVPMSDIAELKQNNEFNFTHQDKDYYTIVKGISFNWKTGAAKDLHLRRALEYSIDRAKLTETLFFGEAEPCGRMFNPLFPDGPKEDEEFTYDIEKAKSILKDAGYVLKDNKLTKDGNPVVLKYVIGPSAQSADLAVFLQNSFKEVGVELDIQSFDPKLIMDELSNGRYDIANIHGWFEPVVTAVKLNGIKDDFDGSTLGFGVSPKAIESGQKIMDAKDMEAVSKAAKEYFSEQFEQCAYLPLYTSARHTFFSTKFEGFNIIGGSPLIDMSKVRKIHE